MNGYVSLTRPPPPPTASSVVQRQAFGVVFLCSPWNYPVSLLLEPLGAALAAGNVCVVKPSEVSVHVSALMADLIRQYLDPRCVTVVEVGHPSFILCTRGQFYCRWQSLQQQSQRWFLHYNWCNFHSW